ncbi:unnamed protein product [Diatraea saccharalis]|uniref:Uncharacterized protein n=1 Tax=Diatraea saccharalis TaxID=40085 RepID=A0A9N9RBJ9_9NEOP|nr:unnamed protein product [Diatraea saccharalis]
MDARTSGDCADAAKILRPITKYQRRGDRRFLAAKKKRKYVYFDNLLFLLPSMQTQTTTTTNVTNEASQSSNPTTSSADIYRPIADRFKLYDFSELSRKCRCAQVQSKNEVDIIALPLLDDKQIEALIPSIGPQAKFKKAIADWKAGKEEDHAKTANNDEAICKLVDIYGSSVGGLAPSENSPITSPVSTPTSSRSLCSLDIYSNAKLDLTQLLRTTQEGRLLLKQHSEALGKTLRKTLVKEIAAQILKHDPKLPVTNDVYSHWIQQISKYSGVIQFGFFIVPYPKGNNGTLLLRLLCPSVCPSVTRLYHEP